MNGNHLPHALGFYMDSQNECSDIESWSHVRETINMLYLAVCQIETTMADSNTSVDTLHQFIYPAGQSHQ